MRWDDDLRVRARKGPPRWKRWFAWYPVCTLDGTWVWFETIERITWTSSEVTTEDYLRSSGMFWTYRLLRVQEPR